MINTFCTGDVDEHGRATAYRLGVFARGRHAVTCSQLEIQREQPLGVHVPDPIVSHEIRIPWWCSNSWLPPSG
jgi:hypothetical protein